MSEEGGAQKRRPFLRLLDVRPKGMRIGPRVQVVGTAGRPLSQAVAGSQDPHAGTRGGGRWGSLTLFLGMAIRPEP